MSKKYKWNAELCLKTQIGDNSNTKMIKQTHTHTHTYIVNIVILDRKIFQI